MKNLMDVWFVAGLATAIGWVLNVVWIMQMAQVGVTEITWQLMVATFGLFLLPLGSVHGFLVWFI